MSIEELKKIQDKVIKITRRINFISFIIGIIVVAMSVYYFFVANNNYYNDNILFSCFVFIFIEVVVILIFSSIFKSLLTVNDCNTFKRNFKEIFVLSSLKKVFSDITYEYDKGLAEHVIGKTELMGLGDRYTSNDYVKGKYKDINFEQADIHIEEKREVEDSDGNKRTEWVTLFLGRWMIFDFNKNFKSNIHIYKGRFKLWWQNKYKKVTLEDEDFNRNFSVFAENEHDAFYILTPHFMEKIKNIVNNLNCNISFGFVDNKLHVAINNNKDSFEHSIYKRINEEEIVNNIMKDIVIITKFVEELDLDNDLFKDGE